MIKHYFLIFLLCIGHVSRAQEETRDNEAWPAGKIYAKPWTRWWWMGSAVDKKNITGNLSALHKAGIGGVEITPIYGVKGEEENFIGHLSPRWIEMLHHTVKVADSLGMKADMVMGTGWPYGGPQVEPEFAAGKLTFRKYQIKAGKTFDREIEPEDPAHHPHTRLQYVFAYDEGGEFTDLSGHLDENRLRWEADDADYTLYAVFGDKTGQKVKRAAPGGEGLTLDHYSKEAFEDYAKPYDTALKDMKSKLRAVFNDSYEVYGTDYTPRFFEAFKKLRGYDLAPYFPFLLDTIPGETANRVKSDYRETISDLLLENFVDNWTEWAHSNGFESKLQAHGSPGNLIDLYAAADIPECETFGSMPFDIPGLRRETSDIRKGDADRIMLKFASSAAHIAGKPLVSSETFTWLREHFKTALSQCKPEVEELFISGVNHVFLHGTTYAPERAVWPGWKFYASVNFHPNNTIWKDIPDMFSYISRCQAILQEGEPGRDVLLYWPVYDTWGKNLGGSRFFQFKIHALGEWLHGTSFYETANELLDNGYAVDFVSDRFIAQAEAAAGDLQLPGGRYKAIVIPDCEKMPLTTLKKLLELKKQGARIIFLGTPESVPGLYNYSEQNAELQQLLSKNHIDKETGDHVVSSLEAIGISPEKVSDFGLKFIRREYKGGKFYFLVNHGSKAVNEMIPLRVKAKQVRIMDPISGRSGVAKLSEQGDYTRVRVQIKPGESLFLHTSETDKGGEPWRYYEEGKVYPLTGKWKLSFLNGGPELPRDISISDLGSWTTYGPGYEAFSGTAKYVLEFDRPEEEAENWKLNLGDVRESARVWLNGKYVGCAWSVPFILETGELKKKKNVLEIEVTNLAADRIRDMELKGEEWKIFYDANIVNRNYKKFDASRWDPMPSGLLGPVSLVPLYATTETEN
ncbi:glycoside hydrolase [Sinomicrobium pectinilyticum]|uniref:Glycoside hydrolase n=1 Tax=Sinomicrobium pectinilyticum TaxID=1084421 RepID=A0A3N0DRL6_SINP1|nr:glycosyl hydrolase [Sinomicrobium pectinilyticum]RNL78126.1 glycoside hydrolase [Sinomicrobium pectinilyticum]